MTRPVFWALLEFALNAVRRYDSIQIYVCATDQSRRPDG
jgi:hypothetical protein